GPCRKRSGPRRPRRSPRRACRGSLPPSRHPPERQSGSLNSPRLKTANDQVHLAAETETEGCVEEGGQQCRCCRAVGQRGDPCCEPDQTCDREHRPDTLSEPWRCRVLEL